MAFPPRPPPGDGAQLGPVAPPHPQPPPPRIALASLATTQSRITGTRTPRGGGFLAFWWLSSLSQWRQSLGGNRWPGIVTIVPLPPCPRLPRPTMANQRPETSLLVHRGTWQAGTGAALRFVLFCFPLYIALRPTPHTQLVTATLFLPRLGSQSLFFLSSRLCPQPTNLLIGFYLRPNEVLLY